MMRLQSMNENIKGDSAMKVCEGCNKTFEDEHTFCPHCGKKLIAFEEVKEEPEETKTFVSAGLNTIDNNRSKPLFLKIFDNDKFRNIGYLLAFVVGFLIAGPVGGILGVVLFYFVMKFVRRY